MRLSANLSAFVAISLMGAAGTFAQDVNKVISSFKSITFEAYDVQVLAGLTTESTYEQDGGKILNGLNDLARTINQYTTYISVSNPVLFNDSVSAELSIVTAGYAQTLKATLDALNGKHNLAEQFVLAAPIKQALDNLQIQSDMFASTVLGFVPTDQQQGLDYQLDFLSDSFTTILATYSE